MPTDNCVPVLDRILRMVSRLAISGSNPHLLHAGTAGLTPGCGFHVPDVITMFLVQNPRTGNVLMPVSFNIYLLASIVGIGIVYQAVTRFKMVQEPKNFPFMLAISLALWTTVML